MNRIVKKSVAPSLAVLLAGGVMFAQTQGGSSTGTAAPKPGAAQTRGAAESDSHAFIRVMAEAGMAEVQLGELAAKHAQNAEVVAFAERMIKDHSRASEALKPIAAQFKAQLPAGLDPKHRTLYEELQKLDGPEFDKQYMAAMVNGHEEVAAGVRARAQHHASGDDDAVLSADPEEALTAWAARTLLVVEEHLALAKQLHDKLE
jgi:putative membrane protein